MASVTIFCIVVMTKIWLVKGFNFLIFLCAMVILTDIGIATLVVALQLQNLPFGDTRNTELSIFIGLSNILFIGGTSLYHWIFSFKYWVMATEVAKVLKNEEIKSL